MTLEEFQQEHGAEWSKIVNSCSFTQGMIFLSLEATAYIKNLSDEQIKNDAPIILADLRGRMRHEAELFALPIITSDAPPDLQEEYTDPVKENFEIQSLLQPPAPPNGRRKPKKRK